MALKRNDIVEFSHRKGELFLVEIVEINSVWTSRIPDGYEPGWCEIRENGNLIIKKVRNAKKKLENMKDSLEKEIRDIEKKINFVDFVIKDLLK